MKVSETARKKTTGSADSRVYNPDSSLANIPLSWSRRPFTSNKASHHGTTVLLFFACSSIMLLSSFLQAKGLAVPQKANYRLSKPLIGGRGRVYACSERNLFAFHRNGSIAWSVPLNYTCDVTKAPIHGPIGMIYVVAENRVLKIDISKAGDSKYVAEVLIGEEDRSVEVIGLAVSFSSASVFVTVKNRGLFAYTLYGRMIWSIRPVLSQFGYGLGCKKNKSDCYFSSVPVVSQCEASIYIFNAEGELYSISSRSHSVRWIQDFSSFGTDFIISPGNNAQLYVTVPDRALVLALNVNTGDVLWKGSIGPLNLFDGEPVVDSNGWISVGSLDGFLYSFSPKGVLKKFSKLQSLSSVIQVSPVLDCSGYGVYISQTEVEGKVTRTFGNYTYVSALNTRKAVFSLLVPVEGSFRWSESYHDQFASLFAESDLHHFVVDERILLALVSGSNTGNPLHCRSPGQKLASSCSKKHSKHPSIFIGNERLVVLVLFLETVLLIIFAGLVRFCCLFWMKKKIRREALGTFLQKRISLQETKKAFDRRISALEQKVVTEAAANHEVLAELSDLVKEREGLQRKLSTTYSLGRDAATGFRRSKSSLLPLYNGKTKSYSFQGSRRESVTIFHTLSDSSVSSGDSSSRELKLKAKGKAPAITAETSSAENADDDDDYSREVSKGYEVSPATSTSTSSSGNPPTFESDYEAKNYKQDKTSGRLRGYKTAWLKRRPLSSTSSD